MNANNVTVSSGNLNCVIGKSVEINKYVLVGLNTAFMLPLVIRNYSTASLIAMIAVTLILVLVAFKSSRTIPAVANIPLIALGDAVIWITATLIGKGYSLESGYFSAALSNTNLIFWIMLLGGAVLGFIGFANKTILWVTGISGGLMGTAFILAAWSNFDFEGLRFHHHGGALLMLFVIAAIAWTVVLYFIVKTAPKYALGSFWIGVLLLAATIVLVTYGADYTRELALGWTVWLRNCPTEAFAWWKIILACVLMFGCVLTLYVKNGNKGRGLSADAYALALVGTLLLNARVLMSNYFPHLALILIVIVFLTVKCMKNDYTGKKTFRLNSVAYLIVQCCTSVAVILLLRNGLWMNLLISAVFLTALYVQRGKPDAKSRKTMFWATVLLCIVLEAAAWTWAKSFSMEKMIVFAMVLAVGYLAILFSKQQRAGLKAETDLVRIVICVCAALVCFATMLQYGAKIREDYNESTATVSIEVEAKGKDNGISSASYNWQDTFGVNQSPDKTILGGKARVRSTQDKLTIVAKDKYGVVSTKVLWYPQWVPLILGD